MSISTTSRSKMSGLFLRETDFMSSDPGSIPIAGRGTFCSLLGDRTQPSLKKTSLPRPTSVSGRSDPVWTGWFRASSGRRPVGKSLLRCWGASHPQTNFLSIAGIAQFVDYLVDEDKNKHGKYVTVAGRRLQPVVSTNEALGRSDARTILLTAFGYPEWIARVQKQFASRDVRFVDPYLAVATRSH